MASLTVWTVMLLLVSAGAALTASLAETAGGRGGTRRPLLVAAGCVVTLLVLALALLVRPVAEADGEIVRVLSRSRSSTLASIMNVVTTMGDTVPTLCLAAALSLVLHRQGRHPVLAWVLPVLVLVELVVQISIGHVFGDLTVADVAGSVVTGGHGYLPSGSVARLSAIFMVTALLWSGSAAAKGRLVTAGAVLVVVQSASRLYLGRHLVLDIAGGLALGLLLTVLVALLIRDRRPVEQQ